MPADFVSLVLADGPVAALVGDRMFPLVVPPQVFSDPQEGSRPCIVYRTVSALRTETFCATDDLIQEFFSLDCYALTYDGAKALAEAVIAAVVDVITVSGSTQISRVSLTNEFDLLDIEPGLYRRNLALTVWHRSA